MAFNLAALLGLTPQAPVEGANINVTAQPNVRPPMEALMNSQQQLQASPTQATSQAPLEGLPEHKGLFGVKGTFRDILGLVGDSLSVGTGGKAIYHPQRQQEKLSDAMVGFTDSNPLPAINRVAAVNPELARQMHEKYLTDVARQDKLALDRENSEYDNNYKKAQIAEKGRKNLSALFSSANETTYPRILEAARRAANSYGIDEDELPQSLEEAKRWGLDPYQSNRLEQYDAAEERQLMNVKDQMSDRAARRDITVRGQNVSAATSRANNANSVAATKRGQDMTDKRQRELAKERGSGRRRAAPPPAGGAASSGGSGKYVLRNGKFVKQ